MGAGRRAIGRLRAEVGCGYGRGVPSGSGSDGLDAAPSWSTTAATGPSAQTLDERMVPEVAVGILNSDGHGVVIQSLTLSWVPEPHIGTIELTMRSDGRFGAEDHLLFPQVLSATDAYLALIPRRPQGKHSAAILWDSPLPRDFNPVGKQAGGDKLGVLKADVLDRLKAAIANLERRISKHEEEQQATLEGIDDGGARQVHYRLTQLREWQENIQRAWNTFAGPSTFAVVSLQWAHLHRCFAEAWAWLDWEGAISARRGGAPRMDMQGIAGGGVVGGICEDSGTALTLYKVGAPVWLLLEKRTVSGGVDGREVTDLYTLGNARMGMDLRPSSLGLSARAAAGHSHAETIRGLSARVYDFLEQRNYRPRRFG